MRPLAGQIYDIEEIADLTPAQLEAAQGLNRALLRHLAEEELRESERRCLGDWCRARGIEQAIAQNLPFKIHTGYYEAQDGCLSIGFVRHICASY